MNALTPPPEVLRGIAELRERERDHGLRVASYIEANPVESIADAKSYVAHYLALDSHARYHWVLRLWEQLLNRKSVPEIAGLFRSADERTQELRSSLPFCGPKLEAWLRS